jgi:hypothetical protein
MRKQVPRVERVEEKQLELDWSILNDPAGRPLRSQAINGIVKLGTFDV